ncbi:MAG TPA: phage tail sheath C-terminal domain-containing protein [Kofleriaceae bacterium]
MEEIPKLPPSVAEVSTAIPAFIGYTEKVPASALARVTTLLEFRELFGGPPRARFTVSDDQLGVVRDTSGPEFLLYYAIQHYFKNGGGPCYVVSAGSYSSGPIESSALEAGLRRLAQEDEPTLVVQTDAVNLDAAKYYALCDQALTQCHDLGDRFAIFDVKRDAELGKDDKDVLRNRLGMQYLCYGAAYYPYLRTLLSYEYDEADVAILPPPPWVKDLAANTIRVSYAGSSTTPSVKVTQATTQAALAFSTDGTQITIALGAGTDGKPLAVTGNDLAAAWKTWQDANPTKGFTITAAGTGNDGVTATDTTQLLLQWSRELSGNAIKLTFLGAGTAVPTVAVAFDATAATPRFAIADRALTITVKDATVTGAGVATAWATWKSGVGHDPMGFDLAKAGTGSDGLAAGTVALRRRTLESIRSTDTALYNKIKARLTDELVTLPPSAAIAGIYARVDRDRGVWKAPANQSLSDVIEPVVKITDAIQDDLNIDTTAGKSINAIRAFTGKGTLVWGARTLAGNDNEWRYVPVRRLFIMIEESAKKSTSFAVFEPNDMTTWLKVKGMIESFLYGLWERGALAGPTPASAYFVNVGLGKTMTTQDILEGRMIVEIGVAAVRPAEFIILRFSHKLQEA